ncbi:4-demethylwyosine synthase TYW1 [Candidatus Woesearchaeota archaeon]|nr:4-demethylwyosine synthase TYW1 [Candidatus Woesearchaeota archaeon]
MITNEKRLDLEKQGYRVVGNHSAIKVCEWTKKSIRGTDVCYKCKFYGINTWQCVQMTPALPVCNQRCLWCWRDINFTKKDWQGPIDSPKDIVDGCIREHVKYLQGFGGNQEKDEERFVKSLKPLHFAISLSGEPTFYPKLPELIDEINSRGMTTFLVTNGTNPEMLKRIINHQPTQLYLTLPAPDEETYKKACNPLDIENWKNIHKSLMLLKNFKRSVIRLTLVKGINMIKPEKYAELFKQHDADYIECKAYVWVGYSRERLAIENMPRHNEIIEFAKEIIKHYPELKIIDEKKESRVVLLSKADKEDRVMKF